MTYKDAKAYKQELEEKNDTASKQLNQLSVKNSMGLVPEHVRSSAEWKEAKKKYEVTFSELRIFNDWFLKTYKKEYLNDRRNHYKKK